MNANRFGLTLGLAIPGMFIVALIFLSPFIGIFALIVR